MRIDHPSCNSSTVRRARTPTMLAIVAALQLLDWHSTLTASAHRHETNWMLNALGRWMGFGLAISLVKAVFLLTIAAGYLFWRKHRDVYEFEFGICLALLIIVYSGVVANNYCAG